MGATCMKVVYTEGGVHTAGHKIGRFSVECQVHDTHSLAFACKKGLLLEVGDVFLPG